MLMNVAKYTVIKTEIGASALQNETYKMSTLWKTCLSREKIEDEWKLE